MTLDKTPLREAYLLLTTTEVGNLPLRLAYRGAQVATASLVLQILAVYEKKGGNTVEKTVAKKPTTAKKAVVAKKKTAAKKSKA